MQPAFRTTRGAVAFCILLVGLAALPVILKWIGPPSAEQLFSSTDLKASAVGRMKHFIYDDPGDTDILIVGSSTVHHGILPNRLQDNLSHLLGRTVRVRVLFLNFPGLDASYFLIREYLARHRVGLVVLSMPVPNSFTNAPHATSYSWLSYADMESQPKSNPFYSKFQMYGELVLGAPRQLLAKIRPNLIADDDNEDPNDNLGSNGELLRQQAAEGTQAAQLPGKPLGAQSVPVASLYAPSSPLLKQSVAKIAFMKLGLGPYTLNYLHEIGTLITDKGSKLVLLNMPINEPSSNDRIPEFMQWSKVLGKDIKIVGLPTSRLFPGADRAKYFDADSFHLKWPGAAVFTDAISSALVRALPTGKTNGAE